MRLVAKVSVSNLRVCEGAINSGFFLSIFFFPATYEFAEHVVRIGATGA
jgi:hypothetical protein